MHLEKLIQVIPKSDRSGRCVSFLSQSTRVYEFSHLCKVLFKVKDAIILNDIISGSAPMGLCNLQMITVVGPSMDHISPRIFPSVKAFRAPYSLYTVGCRMSSFCHTTGDKESISSQSSLAYSS